MSGSAHRAGIAANLALAAAALVLSIGTCEGVARLLLPEQHPLFSDPELRLRDRSFVRAHPERGFELVPGWQSERYRINSRGLRGPEPDAGDDRFTILALGESTTFGWLVSEGEDYPAQLAHAIATAGRDVRVLNGGVPSYTSSQLRLYQDELLRDYQPDVTLIALQWNDLIFSLLPGWYPDLLVHQQPPAWQRFLLANSRAYQALLARGRNTVPGSKPNEAAIRTYRENLLEIVGSGEAAGAQPVLLASPLSSGQLRSEGRALGLQLTPEVLVRAAARFQDTMAEVARETGVPFIEHRLARDVRYDAHLFADAFHPTARGNRELARELARALERNDLLPSPSSPPTPRGESR